MADSVSVPLGASNVNLFKTNSDILLADGYMYFQGTDHAVWRVSANLTNAISDYNNFGGPSRIKTQSNVFPAGGFVYFRGTDDKVWQMRSTEPYDTTNLGGLKTRSNIFVLDGYMYFQGMDQAVWRVSVTNPTADKNNFGGPSRIKTRSSIFVLGNYMYFQGADNKVWQMSITEPHKLTNLGGFKTNSDVFPFEGYIYFQGIDHEVWRVSIAKPATDNNNFGGPKRINTQSNVYAADNYMYFRDTNDKVWRMSMAKPYDPINVGHMTTHSNVVPFGKAIYFRGTDKKLWSYSFEILPLKHYITAAVYQLQDWYDGASGVWNTTGWWNSANALYALIDFTRSTGSPQVLATFSKTIQSTFHQSQCPGFINEYYDDEGWWALTWINAYDLTGVEDYLHMAKSLFVDMNSGWTDVCGGGVYWKKHVEGGNYKNAVQNEQYPAIAVKLYQRSKSGGDQKFYKACVRKSVNWFSKTGLLNADNLINDGLNDKCTNNGSTTWSYNQGVIIGALCDINDMNDSSITWNGKNLLDIAISIANAVIAPSSALNSDGILIEPGDPRYDNGGNADRPQFKGIFMRNLARLVASLNAAQAAPYVEFIFNNVKSMLKNGRNPINQYGYYWGGEFDTADASRQSSALEALNAAIAVQSKAREIKL